MSSTGLVQFVDRFPLIDLGWGHPDPALLPMRDIQSAALSAAQTYGNSWIEYGYAGGPSPLVRWVADHVEATDGRRPIADEIVVTAGSSWGLDHLVSLFAQPSRVVLVEAPTYHLAIKIFRDHDVDVRPVRTDDEGVIVEEVASITRGLKRLGKPPPMLYTIPTFSNPTGSCLGMDRRLSLVQLASDEGILIVEDDAYRELFYDGPTPPSLWSLAPTDTVIRLQSLSKTLAPGLRVGYVTAGRKTARRFIDSGVLDSGGGISHFAAIVVAEYIRGGTYDAHVQRLRAQYRLRRDSLASALTESIPGLRLRQAQGGYFLWGTFPENVDSSAFLSTAEQFGVAFIPGSSFYLDGVRRSTFRVSFSRFEPDILTDAARRLGTAFDALLGDQTDRKHGPRDSGHC